MNLTILVIFQLTLVIHPPQHLCRQTLLLLFLLLKITGTILAQSQKVRIYSLSVIFRAVIIAAQTSDPKSRPIQNLGIKF
mmetsp:Transcript_89369/g.182233  ORF Transcript_89369/g.182233 Transcript_89369/m.182233 type:complete len:80 (-) Transcript_89369:2576-2815(-)